MRISTTLLACIALCASLHAGEAGYTTGNNVNLRAQPASFSESLGTLKAGTVLDIVAEKDGWVEVTLPFEYCGWVDEGALGADGTVMRTPCPVYAGPGNHFSVLYMARNGTALALTGGRDDHLLQVRLPQNATGWLNAAFVQRGTPPTAETAVLPPGNAESELISRRMELKTLHAQSSEQLLQDQQKLEQLQKQAEALREQTDRQTAQLDALQHEAERLEALREAAQARAKLAALEREKAQMEEKRQRRQLEEEKRLAEEKAASVRADSARWQEEARRSAEKLEAAKAEAERRAEAARLEEATVAAEVEAAEKRAKAALDKVNEAARRHDALSRQQAESQRLIDELKTEVGKAAEQVEMLRLKRESMAAATREENAKLAAMRAEAERLNAEQREQAAQIDKARQEQEAVQVQLAALKAENAERKAALAELRRLRDSTRNEDSVRLELEAQLAEEKSRLAAAREKREKMDIQLAALRGQPDATGTAPATAAASEDKPGRTGADHAAEAAATPPPKTRFVQQEGYLRPLPRTAGDFTHALCRDPAGREVVCLARSPRLNLKEWEHRRLRLAGQLTEPDPPRLNKPAFVVFGVIEISR